MLHLRVHAEQSGAPVALSLSFDDAIHRLESLPRMFIEWDGSFVWRGGGETPSPDRADRTPPPTKALNVQALSFQWDGEVIDSGPQVQCIELKGSGDDMVPSLEVMLEKLQLSPEALLVEQVRQGAWFNGASFLLNGPFE